MLAIIQHQKQFSLGKIVDQGFDVGLVKGLMNSQRLSDGL